QTWRLGRLERRQGAELIDRAVAQAVADQKDDLLYHRPRLTSAVLYPAAGAKLIGGSGMTQPAGRSRAASGGKANLRRELARACRILAMAGQGDDIWGHATARVPGTDTFWMKPHKLGLEEVRSED